MVSSVDSVQKIHYVLPCIHRRPDGSPYIDLVQNICYIIPYLGVQMVQPFYMCSLLLPPQVIKQIDRYKKHCLWSGGDINRRGTCLAALGTSM